MPTKVSSAAEMVNLLDQDVSYVQREFGVMSQDVNQRDVKSWQSSLEFLANMGVADGSKVVPAIRSFQCALGKFVSLHSPLEGKDQGKRWNTVLGRIRITLSTLKTLMSLGESSTPESTSPGWNLLAMEYERDIMPGGRPGRLVHLRNAMKMFTSYQSVNDFETTLGNPDTVATVIESCEPQDRRIAAYVMATRTFAQAQFGEGVGGKAHHLHVFDVAFRDSMLHRGVREVVGTHLLEHAVKGAPIEVHTGPKEVTKLQSPFTHLEDGIARRLQTA